MEPPPKPAPKPEPEPKAQPEPNVEAEPEPPKPKLTLLEDPKPLPEVEPPKVDPKPQWLPLADTREQFQHNWRPGDNRGNFFFDLTNKTINIDGPWNLGGFTCPRKWKEFYCEIDVSGLSFGSFDLAIKQATFQLRSMRELPFKASLRVKLDDESGNAVVLLNGARVSQASILDPKWMDSFDCKFSSNGGGNGQTATEEHP